MITLEQAKTLPTPRLLAYYKKHGRGWEEKPFYETNNFEDHEEYLIYWASVRDELNTREHVET